MNPVVNSILNAYLPTILQIGYFAIAAGLAYIGRHYVHGATMGKFFANAQHAILSTVQQFNNEYVADAKANHQWSASDGPVIKQRALDALKSQYPSLVKQGSALLGDLEGYLSQQIDQVVQANHIAQPIQPQQTQQAQ